MLKQGDKFDLLTVVSRAEDDVGNNGAKYAKYLCSCECGGTKVVRESYLKNGYVKSCGCLKKVDKVKKKYTVTKENEFILVDDIAIVKLTNCDEYMLCDRKIWEDARKHIWRIDDHGYASANIKSKNTRFHVYYYKEDGKVIDHIDRDKLNNLSSNIRNVDRRTNNINVSKKKSNTTGYKGVSFDKRRNKFYSYINYESKKRKFLGYYDTAEEASLAREKAEQIYYSDILP